MQWFVFKAAAILIILASMCLPFFPKKFGFSLRSPEYERENRWRNICFVIETVIISCVLLCIAPYIKDVFDWFFNLKWMAWFKNQLNDRFVYTVDVIAIIITNMLICYFFLYIKSIFRAILDKYAFGNDGNTSGQNKNKNPKKTSKDKE